MSKTLTHAAIKRLRPQEGLRPEHPVSGGLYVLVHPSGKKTFVFRYRRPGSGRPAKLTLGVFDETGIEEEAEPVIGGLLTLAGANSLANAARRAIKLGRDPGAERHEAKQGERARRDETFPWAARAFVLRYARPKNRRWRDTAHVLGLVVDRKTDELTDELRKGGLAHRWRDTPLSAIKKRDVTRIIDDYIAGGGSPYTMNVLFASLRKLFNWTVEKGYLEASPLRGLKLPQSVTEREHVLTDDELFAFWRACGKLGEPFGPVFKLLLVTGQRRNEVGHLQRAEIEGDVWTIPKERVKNKREHSVPLSALAQGIIGGVTAVGKRYVFTTTGTTPVSGFSKAKYQLDKLMRRSLSALARKRGQRPRPWRPWRLHDLRRTCATRLAQLGAAVHVVEALLNHKSGTISGVAAIYNRYDYAAEKREAAEAWARLLLDIAEPKEGGKRRKARKEAAA